MSIKTTVEKYMSDVLTGEIMANKWEKLAVKRQADDLKKQNTVQFPYHFDEARAEHIINFTHNFCVHVKGALDKQPLILEPWQQFIYWALFGWVDMSAYRRFNTAFIEVAKKNGKSTMIAPPGMYMGFIEGEGGAEVYSAATTKDQAKIVFHEYARAMVLKSPQLKKHIKVFANSLVDAATETSSFKAVASDVDQLDGKNVHCAIIDEYHAHKHDGVYRIMSDGMSARKQPMTFIITTAGFDPEVPCVDEEEYCQRVLSKKAKNETYFGIIFTLDEGDEWTNKKVWRKSNPCLGVSKTQKAMDRDFQKALDMPSEQSKFKNKNLNIWTRNRFGWIKDTDWEACEADFQPEDMKGMIAYAGIDLATSVDTASYTLAFPMEKKTRFITHIFLPEEGIVEREKQERFEWRRMNELGYCTLTAGRTIDYDYIQARLEEDWRQYDIKEISYDPYNASQFINNLEKLGWEKYLIEFSQSWKFISPASKDWEEKVVGGLIESQVNPVVAWEVANCEITVGPEGNIRPTKSKNRTSKRHIDAVLSMIMALDRRTRNVKKKSKYETQGIISLG